MKQTFTGCLEDNRCEADKLKDFQHEELFAMGAYDWTEKKTYRSFPIRNQDGSSSCVAQTLALMLGVENLLEEGRFVELSAADIYTRRSNKPGGGMIGVNAFEIAKKFGATLEVLMPSQNIGESEINKAERKLSDEQISQVFKTGGYVQLPFDIDKIASVIATGKAVMVWFQFPRSEWNKEPKVSSSTDDIVHHSVTAVDFTLKNGKKYLVIQDSWGLDKTTDKGLRLISEEYIKKRMTFAGYVTALPNNWRDNPSVPDIAKPSVYLTQTLKIGSRGDEVRQLQSVLKYEEMFPQTATQEGTFGPVTDRGVRLFQKKYNLSVDGIIGPSSRRLINSLYK